MAKTKYIIGEIQCGVMDIAIAVTFPDSVGHDAVGRRLFVKENLISAGFVWINEVGEPVPHGESVSLGLKSRGEADIPLLRQAMGLSNEY